MSAGVTQPYYCHQCRQTVNPIGRSTTSLLLCPVCASTFLELLEIPDSAQNSAPFVAPSGAGAGAGDGAGEDADDGVRMLQSVSVDAQSILNEIANIAVGLRSNVGDSGLLELIRQLSEFRRNRSGSPPASRAVVEALQSVRISTEMIGSGVTNCAVCRESFCVGDLSKQLPCSHVYHSQCILPWLHRRNSCPVCRFEFPTDDAEYEDRRATMERSGEALREPLESSRGGFATQLAIQARATDQGSTSRGENRGDGNGNAGGSIQNLDSTSNKGKAPTTDNDDGIDGHSTDSDDD